MGKIAFVFAGQGSQTVGMGRDLYEKFDSARRLFDSAPPVRDLCFNGPKESLDVTLNTQPALFLADLACAYALSERGAKADGAAGFSLGEIPAACYAGLMKPERAFAFVARRAEAMQACAEKNKGAMFAVLKLSSGEVERICAAVGQAYAVNYNCPGQTVVACLENFAAALQNAVSEAGGKAIKLAVSGAFHSPFMSDASADIAAYLENESFNTAKIPLYANATASVYGDPKELLAVQIERPVLWQKTIENMAKNGFDTFIEVGPGKTLSGLIKKINPDLRTYSVYDIGTLEETAAALKQ